MGKLNLKYGFHDTSVTDVKAEADTFILSFESGVYCLDKNGKETNLTPYCQIVIKFSDKHIDQHVIIEQRYKGNYHEINISDFCMSVENNKFDIVIDYYSPLMKLQLTFHNNERQSRRNIISVRLKTRTAIKRFPVAEQAIGLAETVLTMAAARTAC